MTERWRSLARDIGAAHGLGGDALMVGVSGDPDRIASVRADAGRYAVAIAPDLPEHINTLFARLFRDPFLVEWLAVGSVHRNALCNQLSRMACDFVIFHELGHVLAGHASVLEAQELALSELELVRHKAAPALPTQTRQIWEYEADIVGAGFLAQSAAALIRELQKDHAGKQSRAIFGPPQISVEQVASLAIISGFTLFRFIREAAQDLDRASYHPDPLVRAFVLRDAIHAELSKEFSINDELFVTLLGVRFEEFNDALEAIGISSGVPLDDRGIERVNAEMSQLVKDARAYRLDHPDLGWLSWPSLC